MHFMRKITLLLGLFLLVNAYADKELKENFREIGHGFKKAVKGAGKAIRTTVKKTDKWLDKPENGEEKDSDKKK
jgi:hypothetical protein